MGPLTETRGDLFEFLEKCFAKGVAVSVAHCVSQDLKMSKGIADTFRKKYGRVEELKAQNKQVGEVAILDIPQSDADPCVGQFVYYLVTKPKYFNKPSYKSLRASLNAMKAHAVENGIETIVMPKIGCGLDKLEWSKVKSILHTVFDDTTIAISVFYL